MPGAPAIVPERRRGDRVIEASAARELNLAKLEAHVRTDDLKAEYVVTPVRE